MMSTYAVLLLLENLPNELLHQILRYLSAVDAIAAFYGLNVRFNALLSQLRFSAHDEDVQNLLTSCPHQIFSLALSEQKTYDWVINEFSGIDSLKNLKCLILKTPTILQCTTFLTCSQAEKLLSVDIQTNWGTIDQMPLRDSLRSLVSSLPALRSCTLDCSGPVYFEEGASFKCAETLECLTLGYFAFDDFEYLLSQTPRLRYLNIRNLVTKKSDENKKKREPTDIGTSKLKVLKIGNWSQPFDTLANFLSRLRQLRSLTYSTKSSYTRSMLNQLNPDRWVNILRPLTNLVKFNLDVQCVPSADAASADKDIEMAFNSEEYFRLRNWKFECSLQSGSSVHLYTVTDH